MTTPGTRVDFEMGLITTAHLADACMQLGLEPRCAPHALRPVTSLCRFVGLAQPVRHSGSVDVILEAIDVMAKGSVLVVDDEARVDRACIGDLTVLEAALAGASAMAVNGLHRDTAQLRDIGLPVFSLGSSPSGPLSWSAPPEDALRFAHLGPWRVTAADLVIGDEDGVLLVPQVRAEEVFRVAKTVGETERYQAEEMKSGRTLRSQFDFDSYLDQRKADPAWTFRRHLAERSASIES